MESNNKRALAKKLGISRSSLYYQSKLKIRDQCVKEQILGALSEHPSYGHKRLAIHLQRNKKCILRVMKKYGIKPYRRRFRRHKKPDDLNKDALYIPNYAKSICPLKRNVLWASDFTYFWFRGRFWYLGTVIDVFSREVVGVSFSGNHDKELVLSALREAVKEHSAPIYLHSDQGSEYQSYAYFEMLKEHGIKASFSTKASPWQNGYQESFYSEFKKDLGDVSRFETLGEFMEGLYQQIYYYTTTTSEFILPSRCHPHYSNNIHQAFARCLKFGVLATCQLRNTSLVPFIGSCFGSCVCKSIIQI